MKKCKNRCRKNVWRNFFSMFTIYVKANDANIRKFLMNTLYFDKEEVEKFF